MSTSRAYIFVRNRLGVRGRLWAEIARAGWGVARTGWSGFKRDCNICGYSGRFYPHGLPFGMSLTLDAGCPSCVSLARHRLLKLWFDQNRDRFTERSILHFAPERAVTRFIKPAAGEYVTGDIDPEELDGTVLDIEDIALPDAIFDVAICSHILEHVDDRKALGEIHRVLKPGGLLLAMVPIVDVWSTTYENSGITDERGRLLHFGQADHVRFYGSDFRDRISNAGFALETFIAEEPAVTRYALSRGETIFIGRTV